MAATYSIAAVPDDKHEIARARRNVTASASRASMDLQSQQDARTTEKNELEIPIRRIGKRNHLAEALLRTYHREA